MSEDRSPLAGSRSPNTPFQVTAHPEGDATVLVVSGDIDLVSAPLFDNALRECLQHRPALLVVDLTAVTFLSSAGISALALARRAAPAPTTVHLVANTHAVRLVLDIVGLDAEFSMFATRAEALAAPADLPPSSTTENDC
jgi:anti-sigma B factor antagonist